MDNKTFLEKVSNTTDNDYSFLESYSGTHKKILVKHNSCGNTYHVSPNKFFYGRRCPLCSLKSRVTKRTLTTEDFINSVNSISNDFSFNSEYINNHTNIEMAHKLCGRTFSSRPDNFIYNKCACPVCALEARDKKLAKTTEQFQEELNSKFPNQFTIIDSYKNNETKLKIHCNHCKKDFYIIPTNILRSGHCCSGFHGISNKEKSLLEIVRKIYKGNIEENTKFGRRELDIYIPDLNIGIEFNGIYWHSTKFMDKDAHLNKFNFFKENGIHVYSISEAELVNKLDAVENFLDSILNEKPKLLIKRTKKFDSSFFNKFSFLDYKDTSNYLTYTSNKETVAEFEIADGRIKNIVSRVNRVQLIEILKSINLPFELNERKFNTSIFIDSGFEIVERIEPEIETSVIGPKIMKSFNIGRVILFKNILL